MNKDALNVKDDDGKLRRSLASYKSANTVLRRKLKRYKELEREADELYEQKIAELEEVRKELKEARNMRENTVPFTRMAELEQTIESKNAMIDSMKERLQSLLIEKAQLESTVESMNEERKALCDCISELRKPWWMRLL